MLLALAFGSYVLALVVGFRQGRTHPGPGAVGWYYSGPHAYPFGSVVAERDLPPGSPLVALNGVEVLGLSNDEVFTSLHTTPGESNALRIMRADGAETTIRIPVEHFSWSKFLALYRLRLVLGCVLAGVGMATFSVRPHTLAAWALLAFCLILAINLFLNALIFYPSRPVTVALWYEAFASGCLAVMAVHLGLVFPVPNALVARRPHLLWWVYALGLGFGGLALYFRLEGHVSKWTLLAPVTAGALAFLIGRALVLTMRDQDVLTRQRARVLLTGCSVGLLPTVAVLVLQNVLALRWLAVREVLWSMFAFPAALVYLTVRRESVNARIAIRRGLAYAAAVVVAGVCGWGVATGAARLATGGLEDTPAWTVLLGACTGGALLTLGWRRGNPVLDRWFYPKRARFPEIIAHVKQQLAQVTDPDIILMHVVDAAHDLCGATSATAFLFGHNGYGGHLRTTATLEGMDMSVLARTALVQHMIERAHRLVRRDLVRVEPEYAAIRELALAVFDRLQADVILPLTVHERVVGGVAVGPRISGDVYDRGELDALQAVVTAAEAALGRGEFGVRAGE